MNIIVTFECVGCGDGKRENECLKLRCGHDMCSDCLQDFFAIAIATNGASMPQCCEDFLPFDEALAVLSPEFVQKYEQVRDEVEAKVKVYCFSCNSFIPKTDVDQSRRRALCVCGSETCTVCKEAAHDGDCSSENFVRLRKLAEEQKWQKCPKCPMIYERSDGCSILRSWRGRRQGGSEVKYLTSGGKTRTSALASPERELSFSKHRVLNMNLSIARVVPIALLSSAHRIASRAPRPCIVAKWLQTRGLSASLPTKQEAVPLRKHLKDEAKRKKAEAKGSKNGTSKKIKLDPGLEKWELTVGIEIHAELNTACKLFSHAPAVSADGDAAANSNVALFDAAMPGAQPQFQTATLLPALRAAIALGCDVQRRSGWDRKHYFHWDQPNGYQITQYYEPFAKNGNLSLTADDGVPLPDLNGAESLNIGIKQIQMEQDTAKTTSHGASTYHIDLNRAGHPLIEVITLPHVHSPQAASAVVRKIQAILKSVDACTTGMELGGLRADVNVSIRERGTSGSSSYSCVSGLGQRTEIKNLSSFKAVEDAIVAERDRQISVLEAGGVIEGETRGWSLGATETTRLRGKEGEVDYRYMPDADLAPLFIAPDVVEHLRMTLPELPDETVERVQKIYGLSLKDAKTIVSLDDGDRLDFMEETIDLLSRALADTEQDKQKIGKLVGNWVLHELGGLLTSSSANWSDMNINPDELSQLLANLHQKQITARAAKQLLANLHDLPSFADRPTIEQLIDDGNLRLRPLSQEEYLTLAQQIINENPDMVAAIRDKGQSGKTMWFVGQMVRRGEEGTVEPEKAREVIEGLLVGSD